MLVNSMEDFWKGSIGTYIWRFFKKENDDIPRRALLLKVPDIISDNSRRYTCSIICKS